MKKKPTKIVPFIPYLSSIFGKLGAIDNTIGIIQKNTENTDISHHKHTYPAWEAPTGSNSALGCMANTE